jgi:small subunit ribosomal protein S5e
LLLVFLQHPQDFIAVKGKHATYTNHTAGRYQRKSFRKAQVEMKCECFKHTHNILQCPIVERLACSLMRHGRNSGKKTMACRIIKHTMEIIHILTDQNPVQVCNETISNDNIVTGIFEGSC